MKILLLVLSVLAVVSCGSKTQNTVNSGSDTSGVTGTTGTNGINTPTPSPANLVNFEGNYDIVRMDSSDCGAAIRIERLCNGYRLISNNANPEDFCNVNRGEMRLNNGGDRNPPNPDRNPPPPDSAIVTQEANQLRSVVRVANMAFTNTLTLESNGILTKVSNLKSRQSRCVFLKR